MPGCAGLADFRKQLNNGSCIQFLTEFECASPHFHDLKQAWLCPTSHRHISTAISLLRAFSAVFSFATSSDALPSNVYSSIHQLAQDILANHLKPVYFHLSSGDHARANHALAFLTDAVSLSNECTSLFISFFDFSLRALPKLASPTKHKDNASHSHWTAVKLAKKPTRACYVELVLACLRCAQEGFEVAAVLQAPQLVSLALAHISNDPPSIVFSMCQLLLDKGLSTGARNTSFWNACCGNLCRFLIMCSTFY
jgi:hypothetical protein